MSEREFEKWKRKNVPENTEARALGTLGNPNRGRGVGKQERGAGELIIDNLELLIFRPAGAPRRRK
jgi:hypothetical protein